MSADLIVVERDKHCELSPSGSHRWSKCPGSIRLSREVGETRSIYAEEGTAAHALAEVCLLSDVTAYECDGEIEGVEITDEMRDAVSLYVGYVLSLALRTAPGESWIERPFDLDSLHPPAPMYGTSDFVCLTRDGVLHVVDFKYGAGVAVEVKDNLQLTYYALGAYLSLSRFAARINKVMLTLVQPRAPHRDGPIRSVEVNWTELVDFWVALSAAADAALAPDAPLVAGEHCRFCPALAQCPEVHRQALAIAQNQFECEPFLPAALSSEAVARVLRACDDWLEDWLKAVREYALNELKSGRAIPGYKLVAKRATRKWVNEAEVERWLKSHRLTRVGHEKSLRSVAQMEKAVGKKFPIPASLYSAESSGVTVARESDPRRAVTAGEEFFVEENLLMIDGGKECQQPQKL